MNQQIRVTLSEEMAERVRSRVASGEFASESDVVREGLQALDARDQAIDEWLRHDVAPIFDAMKQDPSRARSVDDVRAALARHDETNQSG